MPVNNVPKGRQRVHRDNRFFISADLAQVNDYTAITVTERVMLRTTEDTGRLGYMGTPITKTVESTDELHLRHIERPERGTSYPRIVERLKELCDSPQLKGKTRTVVIDITGVGRPVWDLLKKARIGVPLKGITITGGNTVTKDGDIYSVPKRDLISSLQVAFQNGQIKIPLGLPEADALVRELTNFKVKINLNGHDQYESWREGIHDDIVLSAAMGVWLASRTGFNLEALIDNDALYRPSYWRR